MTDLEWAKAFVGCKIEGTGIRFNDTVEVLARKLAQVREEAAAGQRIDSSGQGDIGSLKERH